MPKKKKKTSANKNDDELSGFDIKINSFGEMESTMSIDKINSFLNNLNDPNKISEEE